MTRKVLIAAIAALAVPGVASAGVASAVTRDLPLGHDRSLAAASPKRFDLVGLRWRGSGSVELRVRSATGRWSAWMPAAPEDEDLPDAHTAEARAARGWRLGNPWWVGPSTGLQVRTAGAVTAVRGTFVQSPELQVPLRRVTAAGRPAIVPRAGWAADESIRRAEPDVAPAVKLAVVHHTAGTNDYTQAEAAAIVRGIEVYHVKSNGWNDIGYNFLVDRFGTVYEGRYGGVEANVVGAHAQGFNTGSVGVAVLGTYEGDTIPAAAEAAVARLLAWRLDLAHVDPLSTLTYLSNGNPRFPYGIPVFLRAVSGHRDTGFTSCPGDALYARLPALAESVRSIGLPKLYEPLVEGVAGGPVRITARLSSSAAWTVRILDEAQAEIASGSGVGPSVDWTWDASLAPPGRYRWRVDGGPSLTSATGLVGGVPAVPVSPAGPTAPAGPTGPELAFTAATADLDTITPNADGQADQTTITYALSGNANVRADVLDAAGTAVASLEPPRWRRAGEHALAFDGLGLPDGVYAIRLTARAAGGVETSSTVGVAVTRTLGALAVSPSVYAPAAPARPRALGVTFSLSQPATVVVRIARAGRWVATPFSGLLTEGAQRVEWDGTKRIGTVADGDYTAVVEASDGIATTRLEAPFVRDTTPPRVVLASRKPAVLAVGEAARITGLVNNARRAFEARAPGRVRIPDIREVRTLVLFVRDAAGNLAVLRAGQPAGTRTAASRARR